MQRNKYIMPFIWLWMATLMASTVGYSLHRVYCFCIGEARISWVTEAEDACADKMAEVCQLTDKASCCTQKVQERSCCSSKKQSSHDGNCKEKQVRFFKLKTEFWVEKFGGLNSFFKDFPLVVQEFPALQNYLFSGNSTLVPLLQERPPPLKPSGRAICIRHGVFRC